MTEAELAGLEAELDRWRPIAGFPWHGQQLHALREGTEILCLPAGNQGGKTEVAAAVVGRMVRREGPMYARLRNPKGRPLKIWVAPQTLDKYTSNWENRLEERVFRGIEHSMTKSPWPVWRWVDAHGGGELWGKSQDQGWRSFESDVVDLVVFDEEPEDPKLLSSAMVRTSTTNGAIVLAYTPLLGMTWTYHTLVAPTMTDECRVADRYWRSPDGRIAVIQWGMADNPASVAGGGVGRVVNDPTMSEPEKRARLFGEYGFAEGLIFPELTGVATKGDSLYLLDTLPENRAYSWTLTVDPNKRHGGLLVAQDHDNNRYAVAEHYAEGWPDTQHAESYKALVRVTGLDPAQVPTFADPGGAGAQAILNLAECDIWATPVPKGPGSVKASIELIRRLLWVDPNHAHPVTGIKGAPRLYFVRSLRSQWTVQGVPFNESRLLWELRQYRQDPKKAPDTPIKLYDDVVDTLRYHALVRPITPDQAAWSAGQAEQEAQARREKLDNLSQQANLDFDEAVRRLNRPRTQGWDLT